MAVVFLGLGSNIERKKNIHFALEKLRERYGEIIFSPTYESEAVGFEGENFYNLVVRINTAETVAQLSASLRQIEDAAGRDRTQPKFSPRTLDIDILLVDDLVGEFDGIKLPRDEILKNAFVLQPLFDVAPDLIHPESGKSIAALWQAFDKARQKLWLA